jgi:acetyl-CoA synthetase
MEDFIPPTDPGNLQDYRRAYNEFNWASIDDMFDWFKGGTYNVAAEAVDRHSKGPRKD